MPPKAMGCLHKIGHVGANYVPRFVVVAAIQYKIGAHASSHTLHIPKKNNKINSMVASNLRTSSRVAGMLPKSIPSTVRSVITWAKSRVSDVMVRGSNKVSGGAKANTKANNKVNNISMTSTKGRLSTSSAVVGRAGHSMVLGHVTVTITVGTMGVVCVHRGVVLREIGRASCRARGSGRGEAAREER